MIRDKPGEAALILTDLTRQPLEVVRESYKNVTLTLDVDRAYLQRWADILLEQKVMEQRVDVSRALDTSLQPR
ncbi:MAG: hypothetical protein HY725_15700 [Candidatus Rokubacteria bacterium]|nr:hypothetical protein [Candidatus Rokubacteria bacterium]